MTHQNFACSLSSDTHRPNIVLLYNQFIKYICVLLWRSLISNGFIFINCDSYFFSRFVQSGNGEFWLSSDVMDNCFTSYSYFSIMLGNSLFFFEIRTGIYGFVLKNVLSLINIVPNNFHFSNIYFWLQNQVHYQHHFSYSKTSIREYSSKKHNDFICLTQ